MRKLVFQTSGLQLELGCTLFVIWHSFSFFITVRFRFWVIRGSFKDRDRKNWSSDGSFATRLSNVLMSTSFSISTHFLLKTHVVRMTCLGYLVAGVLKVIGKCPTIICGRIGCETQPAFVMKSESIFKGIVSLSALRIFGWRLLSDDSSSRSLSAAPACLARPLKGQNPLFPGRRACEPFSRPLPARQSNHRLSRALVFGAYSRALYRQVQRNRVPSQHTNENQTPSSMQRRPTEHTGGVDSRT